MPIILQNLTDSDAERYAFTIAKRAVLSGNEGEIMSPTRNPWREILSV